MIIGDAFFSEDLDQISVVVSSLVRQRRIDVFLISLIRLTLSNKDRARLKLLRVMQIALAAIEYNKLDVSYGLPVVDLLHRMFKEGQPEIRHAIVDVLALLYLAVNDFKKTSFNDRIREVFNEAKSDVDAEIKATADNVLSETGLLSRPKPSQFLLPSPWMKDAGKQIKGVEKRKSSGT